MKFPKINLSIIKLLAKRLTKEQKNEIVRIFKDGYNVAFLSEKFNCTELTVIRNLKKNLGETKYRELIKNNKSLNLKLNNNEITSSSNIRNDQEVINKNIDYSDQFANLSNSDVGSVDSFLEIAPVDFEIDNSSRKELSSVAISEVDFPKVVYMVVDKKIELEIKLLKDFPEWEFLPHDDLDRKTIEIFFDVNIAKRSCNKDQKVLKVPNTDVFRIASPVLVERGISRIVCAEKLIAL